MEFKSITEISSTLSGAGTLAILKAVEGGGYTPYLAIRTLHYQFDTLQDVVGIYNLDSPTWYILENIQE